MTLAADEIAGKIRERAEDGRITCAKTFALAQELGITPAQAGAAANEAGIRLNRCQLGLFGYYPEKKVVKKADSVSPDLAAAIRAGLANDRLPCAVAWEIASRMDLSRMEVASACESLEIRVKPCQLGAF